MSRPLKPLKPRKIDLRYYEDEDEREVEEINREDYERDGFVVDDDDQGDGLETVRNMIQNAKLVRNRRNEQYQRKRRETRLRERMLLQREESHRSSRIATPMGKRGMPSDDRF